MFNSLVMGKYPGTTGPRRAVRFLMVAVWLSLPVAPLVAQEEPQVLELNLENMVDLTMSSSFHIRQMNLGLESEQLNLAASRASLKSRVDLSLTTPSFRLTAEPRWNSTLQKNEIVQENSRLWQGTLSIQQPVILFGWPTNGYLSFNNTMYRYTQFDDEGNEYKDYYNRYYFSYNQPLFQPNDLKYSLEQAEMALENSQLEFDRDILYTVSGVSEVYHDLLEEHYLMEVRQDLVDNLERALEMAQATAETDSTRAIELDQIQVELANARGRLQSQESSVRLELAEVKQQLGLADTDSVFFRPEFRFEPVEIDMDAAVNYALAFTPTMRQMEMGLRYQEIGLDQTRSRGALRINLRMTYGRERRDEYFDHLWQDPDNSYTVNITASLPIFDHGERRARIASSQIGIEQTRLRMEETQLGIVSDVQNEVLDIRDRETRTMAMQENLRLAQEVSEANFLRYEEGTITAQELILSLLREADTNQNFLRAYLSWKGSLRSLMNQTYYDFEQDRPALDWLREEGWIPENGVQGLLP